MAVDPVPNPAPPSPVPAIVMYVLAAVVAAVSLLATQGLIDNGIEKLVTGLASIFIPFAWVVGNSIYHLAVQHRSAAVLNYHAAVRLSGRVNP